MCEMLTSQPVKVESYHFHLRGNEGIYKPHEHNLQAQGIYISHMNTIYRQQCYKMRVV